MKNKTRIGLIIAIIAVVILISGCVKNKCGDGICQPREERKGSCPEDCATGITESVCGNGACEEGEDASICPQDCRGEYTVKTIRDNTERVDWCPENNMIAFDKKGKDFYYDVYVMSPDGTGEKCITCDREGLPNKHMGNPAWHPSGELIVFTAEKEYHPDQRLSYFSRPGYGFNCDIWIISIDGERYWKLREVKAGLGSYSPHFSHDGRKLGWSECYEKYDTDSDPYEDHEWKQVIHWEFSDWRVNMADFDIEDGIPKIENISQYRILDKKGVHEFHGFSPDDKEILLTGIAEPGKWKGPDIYRINLDTGGSERLTFTPENWDEHAHYTPDMNRIIWVSTSGLNRKRGQIGLDFWEMDGDGKNKQRVTFFNTPDYLNSHNLNSVSCADWAWFGSDGRKIIVDVWEDYPVNDKKAVINPGGRTITFPGRRYVMRLIEFSDNDDNDALPNDFNEGKYKVKSITTIKEYGKRLDWLFVSIENGPIWQSKMDPFGNRKYDHLVLSSRGWSGRAQRGLVSPPFSEQNLVLWCRNLPCHRRLEKSLLELD